MKPILRTAISGFLGLVLTKIAPADLLVYEGFDYEAGSTVDTPLNGGLGFAGPWTRAEEGQNDRITVYDETGPWDGVVDNVPTSPATGARYIGGADGDDRITAQRTLSQAAGELAGADGVLWASIVWKMNGSNFGRQVGFVLGTDGLSNRSRNVSTNGSFGTGDGDAIGVGGAINTLAVTPTIWDGGAVAARTTTGATNVSTSSDNLVVLKFVFATDPGLDRVYAYRFTESDTLSETDFDANAIFAESAIDESTLNVLSFGQSKVGIEAIDEIRLGDTFSDVISGLTEPPQPLEITDISYDGGTDQVSLTWKSNPGQTYGVFWSEDLSDFAQAVAPAVPAHASDPQTSYGPFASPLPDAGRLFFRIGPPDLEAPTLGRVYGGGNTVTIEFSEPMAAGPATNPFNYSVSELDVLWPVDTAVLSPDGLVVTLTLGSPLPLGTEYTLSVSNLTDLAGRSLGNPAVATFQTWDNDPAGVKVFILAGQSNMVGHGKTENGHGDVPGAIGSLRYEVVNDPANYGHLVDGGGNWIVRDDVKVWWRDSDLGDPRAVIKGDLKIGYSQSRNPEWIGPEYGFGWAVGDYYDEDVLIIKCAWGGKSLHVDFRPPSAVAARGGTLGPYYTGMIEYVRDCLTNLGTEFPAFAGRGYQIAGFGWHQGWNDRTGPASYSTDYEENLVDLIGDLRAEFGRPDLPVSITTTGMAPSGPVEPYPYSGYTAVEKAQLAVSDPTRYPGFDGNLITTDTRPFWREASVSPSDFGYHWNHNGESQFLNGTAMGEAMVDLIGP